MGKTTGIFTINSFESLNRTVDFVCNLFFRKRRKEIIRQTMLNKTVLSATNDILINIKAKYKHYNLSKIQTELLQFNSKLESCIGFFCIKETLQSLESKRKCLDIRNKIINGLLNNLDKINIQDQYIFSKKNKFNNLYKELNPNSENYLQKKILSEKIKRDFTELDMQLEHLQNIAKFSRELGEPELVRISHEIKEIEKRFKIIDLKVNYVFFNYDAVCELRNSEQFK